MNGIFDPLLEAALLDAVEPVTPPSAEKLLLRAKAVDRLGVFAPQLGALFGLADDATAALLAKVRSGEGQVPGPAPGVRFLPVRGVQACILFVDAGAEFPRHTHEGQETLLVLEGGLKDSSGVECWRGEQATFAPGTSHAVRALGGLPCICAVLTA